MTELDKTRKFLDDYAFGVTLNANDTFGYACADAVTVAVEDLDKLMELEEKFGHHGVIAFMAAKDNSNVLKELETPEYFEARKSLKGYEFGDAL